MQLTLEDAYEVFVVLGALKDLLFVYATEDGVIDFEGAFVSCLTCHRGCDELGICGRGRVANR